MAIQHYAEQQPALRGAAAPAQHRCLRLQRQLSMPGLGPLMGRLLEVRKNVYLSVELHRSSDDNPGDFEAAQVSTFVSVVPYTLGRLS
jgi:hypothetical protein